MRFWNRRTVGLIAAILSLHFASLAQAQSVCGGKPLPPASVERVLDAQTIMLSDAREVRLAGIMLPLVFRSDARTQAPDVLEAAAAAALRQAAGSSELSLRADAGAPDRYGRLRVFAFVTREGLERSLQHDMLSLGLAVVAPRVGAADCARELLALEREARAGRLGIWAEPGFVRNAGQPEALLAERGRLTLVEGRVLSVRESGGTIYVNFGRRWSEDFTVTIPKRDERSFIAAGLAPKVLERRRVRVRGFIEERGGPWIEARHAEQIEVLQD